MKRRVMVVDDEPLMLEAARAVLERSYAVAAFESPGDALANLREFRPDLAILDIQMPKMDGFELMHRLKEIQPDIDVILMTGSIGEADTKLVRAIEQEAFYFLIKPFDRKVLLTLVDRCLELRRLAEADLRHRRRMENELQQARAFQHGLLPPAEGTAGGLRLSARYSAAEELCGDFYDYAGFDGGVGFLVADVSNHGASAAMITGMIKLAFRSARGEDFHPVAVTQRIADAVGAISTDHFVTFLCGRVCGDRLEYVNAGHPPGLAWRAGHPPQMLRPTARLVHPFVDQPPLRHASFDFSAGSHLLLYTDGVTEAKAETERFELHRLMECVEQVPEGGAALLDHILGALETFQQGRPVADDLTLLAADR